MTPRFLLLVLVGSGVLPFVAAIWFPPAALVGYVLNLLIIVSAVIDIFVSSPPHKIHIGRDVTQVMSVGARNPVRLHVTNRSNLLIQLELHDEYPQPANVTDLPLRVEATPWKEVEAIYHVEPLLRGKNEFSAVHLRYASMLGLWALSERRRLVSEVKIYPDIRAVYRYELMAQRNRLAEVGLKSARIRGQGGEFDRLREYRIEDDMRHIDWKASAKYDKLITREFDVDRNQNIAIMLDCGRSMCNEADGVSHLDRGLNAAIILSYIALSQGDNVSLMAFSNRIERVIRPVRGKPAVQSIIRQTFDLEPRREATDYGTAVEDLKRWQRKRALVILITHVMDEQHLTTIGRYIKTMRTPHLLLCVFLKDVALTELASSVPGDDLEAFQVAAASHLLLAQATKTAELRDSGALILETLPGELSAALINQYLDLKARHLM